MDVLKEIYQELKKEYNGSKVTPEMISYISDVDISKVRSKWGDIVADNGLKNSTQQKVNTQTDNELKNSTQQKVDNELKNNIQQKELKNSTNSTINWVSTNTQQKEYNDILNIINHINPGTNVVHTRFGKGKVIKTDGEGIHKWATIFFPDCDVEDRLSSNPIIDRTQVAHIDLDFVIRNGKLKILD